MWLGVKGHGASRCIVGLVVYETVLGLQVGRASTLKIFIKNDMTLQVKNSNKRGLEHAPLFYFLLLLLFLLIFFYCNDNTQ